LGDRDVAEKLPVIIDNRGEQYRPARIAGVPAFFLGSEEGQKLVNHGQYMEVVAALTLNMPGETNSSEQ